MVGTMVDSFGLGECSASSTSSLMPPTTTVSTFYIGQNRAQYNFGRNHTVLRLGFYTTTLQNETVAQCLGQVIDGDVVHIGP
jgi:hypothetical protein